MPQSPINVLVAIRDNSPAMMEELQAERQDLIERLAQVQREIAIIELHQLIERSALGAPLSS